MSKRLGLGAFYDISTLVGYLMLKSVYAYIYHISKVVSWLTVVEGDSKAPFSKSYYIEV